MKPLLFFPQLKDCADPSLPQKATLDILQRIVIAYPAGNTTAVVFDKLMNTNRKSLNDRIVRAWKSKSPDLPEIEQCCFVTVPRSPKAIARVEMFGGEFCGNATRSVVWVLTEGRDCAGLIEVSGVNKLLEFSVQNGEVGIEMPLSQKGLTTYVNEGILVRLDGIAQLVVTNLPSKKTPRQLLDSLLSENRYNLTEQPAVGVSYYDQVSGKAAFCVWVKEMDTIFDETACGSGTCAIGVARAWKAGEFTRLNVVQPSGEIIRTEADYGPGTVSRSFIAGGVKILYDGALELV